MYQDLKDFSLKLSHASWQATGLVWLCCALFLGCRGEDPIRIYSAPKEPTVAGQPSGPTEPQELLGALIAKEDSPWAFKMIGNPDKVAQYKDQFRQLVDSLTFGDDGQPVWKLPADWREEPGNEFTYRTFRPPNDDTIKATISELAYSFSPTDLDVGKWQQYVLQNVNRWRGQLSLENQAWDEMAGDLETLDKHNLRDLPAYYVSLRGESSGDSMGGPMMSRSPAPLPSASNDRMPTKSKLQATLPEAWREVPPLSIMAWKSYEADGPDATKVQVTYTIAGGDSVSNVMRWSSQIGGTEELASQAIDKVEKLEVNGKPTELFKLVGPEPDPKAITVAIVKLDDTQALFVKMTGPAKAVDSQNEAFVALLKSTTW